MKTRQRVLSLLLSIVMILGVLPLSIFAADSKNGLDNFSKLKNFNSSTFTDVSADDWYYGNVKTAYQYGLMVGNSETTFNPDGNVKLSETITVAARLHSIYYNGSENFAASEPWYQSYVDYAKANRIITKDYADYSRAATRAEYAVILASALPKEALEAVNKVADNKIPDVKISDSYGEAVYTLYRAGILTGSDDKGTYNPDSNIRRSEVAAIVSRMADVSLRKSIKLGDEYTVTFVDGTKKTTQTVFEGECAVEPKAPTKTGYKFDGWYTSANGGSKFDFITKITGDITLYAHWNSNGFLYVPDNTFTTHVHTYKSFVTMATCTADGYTIYKCSGCDDEYVDDFVECNGHTWSEWSITSPATCYTFGLQTRQCTVCGQPDTAMQTQLTHDYAEDGTCVVDGIAYTVYRCINCNHTELVKDSEKPNVATQDFVYDCDTDFSFTVSFDGSESELRNRLTIVETQAEGTLYDKSGSAQVTYILTKQDNNSWLVTPDGSYENGARYAARLSDDSVSFTDYQGNRLNFVIKRRNDQTVIRINNDILYLKALEKETPGYYPYKATEPNENGTIYLTVGRADRLNVGDLLCVGDYLNGNEIISQDADLDSYYIGKIAAILPEHDEYVLVLETPEISEIYDELDVALSIDWDRMDEVMDEEAQAELDNAVLNAMLEDDKFVAYLASMEQASAEYLAERGMTPSWDFSKDFEIGKYFKIKCSAELMNYEQYSKLDDHYKGFNVYSNGNVVIIVAGAEITAKFPFKTEDGNTNGDLTVKTNVRYTNITNLNAVYSNGKYSIGTICAFFYGEMANQIEFELGVHFDVQYSAGKEETPFVRYENTGTYHCAYCRIVKQNENTSSFTKLKVGEVASVVKSTLDDLNNSKFCGVCKPQMAILSDYLFVNENTQTLHIASCYHVNDNSRPIKGMASVLETQGYSCCSDCNPKGKQGEYLAEQISIKMSAGGMETELEEMKKSLKDLAKGCGTSVSDKSDKKHLVSLELPVAGPVGIYVQFDFVFDFDLDCQAKYVFEGVAITKFDAEYTCTHMEGFSLKKPEFRLNLCETTKREITKSDLTFEGTINTRIGGQLGVGVYLGSSALSFGLHAGAGLYADLNGYLKSDFLRKDWYGGARFEAGLYVDAGLEGRLIFWDWEYPLVDWKETKTPLLNYGYDEIWTTFITTPELVTVGNLTPCTVNNSNIYREGYILPDDTFLKINMFDLKKMESGTKTLNFTAKSNYSIRVEENSDYFDVINGVLYVAHDAPEEFDGTFNIVVETANSWKQYKPGSAVSYLDSYTVSINYDGTTIPDAGGKYEFNGHKYQIFNNSMTWTEAKEYCESLGGHLATVTSAEENDFISSLIANAEKELYWLGGVDEAKNGSWGWVTSEVWDYTNWNAAEPTGGQYCLTIYSDCAINIDPRCTYGKWNDNPNMGCPKFELYRTGIICEWDDDNSDHSSVCLEDMPIIAHDRYTGNQGDSTIFNLNGQGLTMCDDGKTGSRNGNIGVDGTEYHNGFEAWIARWNFGDKISWASATFDIGGKFNTLTGKTSLIRSYNTKNFDTTVYFYNGEVLLASYRLTPSDYMKDIDIDVTDVHELKLLVKDNIETAGGTSFALYDMFLSSCDTIDVPFAGGDGTESNPYQIATPEQLDAVRNNLSAHYVQINDIDMSKYGDFCPIGIGMPQYTTLLNPVEFISEPFKGSYDGGNYKITGLNISENILDCVGLFSGCDENSIIKNVILENASLSINKIDTDYTQQWKEGNVFYISAGLISGYSSGSVVNCHVSGSINIINCNSAIVGGVVGWGNVSFCTNKANINVLSNKDSRYVDDGNVWCGGITGRAKTVNGSTNKCINYANISVIAGNQAMVGGISGQHGALTYCINYGTIKATVNYPASYSSTYETVSVGGIFGSNSSDNTSYCVNLGSCEAIIYNDTDNSNYDAYAGGIGGYSGFYSSGIVTDCYNGGSDIVAIRYYGSQTNGYSENKRRAGRVAGKLNGYLQKDKNNYSLGTTLINGNIATEQTTDTEINGATITQDEFNSKLEDILNYIDYN